MNCPMWDLFLNRHGLRASQFSKNKFFLKKEISYCVVENFLTSSGGQGKCLECLINSVSRFDQRDLID